MTNEKPWVGEFVIENRGMTKPRATKIKAGYLCLELGGGDPNDEAWRGLSCSPPPTESAYVPKNCEIDCGDGGCPRLLGCASMSTQCARGVRCRR